MRGFMFFSLHSVTSSQIWVLGRFF